MRKFQRKRERELSLNRLDLRIQLEVCRLANMSFAANPDIQRMTVSTRL